MADLSINFAGIKAPNPFWLASAPPTDKAYNVIRAFEAGWGGVVWKTLGEDPAPVNVSSRYSAHFGKNREVIGFNNIELITDRSLAINLREITAVKQAWPDRAMIVSLMFPCEEESWKRVLPLVEATGADGIELNFGCPHGMPERGMGAAVGQVPEYVERITRWCKQYCSLPVIVKLTPNITDVRLPARAARAGGADAVSLINTINSITSVDLEQMIARPIVGQQSTHGGYCGPAVKPIALNMVAEIARDPATRGLPISGIGGIGNWRDAAEFLALGAGSVQVCTAAMLHGFRIVNEMCDGLSRWMDQHGYATIADFSGKAIANTTDWKYLDMNYEVVAAIDQDLCIACGRCYIACEDTSHQSISQLIDANGARRYEVKTAECVGCNLCQITCPVENCISMLPQNNGKAYMNWTEDARNPRAVLK
ncbi:MULTISPECIES: NAD-dependent dihydropyrimidine dehydrogenase subunit PreA [unclassified Undibacterium]|uniref:NAD-dependent dihydropyrimidine dehydrogenase subunit PreA n=1 Tax=unclassified Undibacterium TaxID=2630295 RepID=UPI002AC9563F|nr:MULTISPECIES: NAD-dependent dihydropyrimidine dehydrogenase subunit PreA [unclassified Undibacterium]MEB0138133.1 NAD-dependent dihydropyrimidine dehydrogenase subunit PreA [Undibacterium sp. CCC2.1]MEB0171112.1 NAD-dependent dihydropyrimidine dehydrogenase subunit PreA [Undibacterium sp. CCC1.1]MEB0175157.1 NAD-dependent dihydropyrimidine dehydrogenase subunit PreA [Undibacterium sp. CCC3.4]MEB0214259.1 NAD-dependent dihydropyrimidine dehydrogenase subunit PreA [Undibacterium sp. 5I2]WPX41